MKPIFRVLVLFTLAVGCAWPDVRLPSPKGERSVWMLAAGVLLSAAIFFAGRWYWKRRKRHALRDESGVGAAREHTEQLRPGAQGRSGKGPDERF
jgi:hypothetical protein